MDMKLTIEGLEKERDFYVGKLRDSEVVVQEIGGEEDPAGRTILDILYATEEVRLSVPTNDLTTSVKEKNWTNIFLRF